MKNRLNPSPFDTKVLAVSPSRNTHLAMNLMTLPSNRCPERTNNSILELLDAFPNANPPYDSIPVLQKVQGGPWVCVFFIRQRVGADEDDS